VSIIPSRVALACPIKYWSLSY